MRLKIARSVCKFALLAAGLILLIAAIFAVPLGLDNDAGWGKGRILLALFGGCCLIGSSAIQFPSFFAGIFATFFSLTNKIQGGLINSTLGKWSQNFSNGITRGLQGSKSIQHARNFLQHRAVFFSLLGVIVSLLLAVWFFTAGRMTVREPNTYYFDQLANGFLAGQLSLLEPPSDQLLAMSDPYDWQARSDQQIPFIWDVSLYNQKYYLYWGPVPALLAAAVKIVYQTRVYDAALVFFFYTGILLTTSLVLFYLRKRFFPRSPAWLLGLLVMMIGATAPLLYLINHPNVYETAISGGQFFLTLGLYALLKSTQHPSNNSAWLLVSGTSWGLAVGCRATLAVPVIVLTLIFAVYLIKNRKSSVWIPSLISLGTPLALCAGALAWYNWARFGSLLETGVTYQLSGPAIPHPLQGLTSLDYLVPNLYSYFFRAPIIELDRFPYIVTPFVEETMWPSIIRLPDLYYYPEPMVGILVIVPAVWLIGLPVINWVKRFSNWLHELPAKTKNPCPEQSLIGGVLLTGSVMALVPLLVFIAPMYRYLSDFFPVLGLFTAWCLWGGLESYQFNPVQRRAVAFFAVGLIILSILVGFFGSFVIGTSVFEDRNPALFRSLANFFN